MKIKKIVAGMVAGVMAASMMSIGASATFVSSWQTYHLYMYTGMPPGYSNVTSLTIGGTGANQVFATEYNNYLKVDNHKVSMSANYVEITGQVYVNGSWRNVTLFNHYSTETTDKSSGYIYTDSTPKESVARTIVNLHITASNQDANCQIIAR